MAPRKSVPKGIDPAYPQKNFVKASYDNKGDSDGYFDYMYGSSPYAIGAESSGVIKKKASGYGHGVERRRGCLRVSGNPRAHQVGKRSK